MGLTVTQMENVENIIRRDYTQVKEFFADKFRVEVRKQDAVWEKNNPGYVKLTKQRQALINKKNEIDAQLLAIDRQFGYYSDKPLDKDVTDDVKTFISENMDSLKNENLIETNRQYGNFREAWAYTPSSIRSLGIIKGLMKTGIKTPDLSELYEVCRRGVVLAQNMLEARAAIAIFYQYDWKSIGISFPPMPPNIIASDIIGKESIVRNKQITYTNHSYVE
jgi:hypothetical protein